MRIESLLVAVLLALIPAVAPYAHAVIIRSSLEANPASPNRATPVSLFFNSDIETALSTVHLVTRGDRKQPVSIRHGRRRGEMVVELPPLPPGEYALQYKVFAIDGHLTEDVVKFSIREEE